MENTEPPTEICQNHLTPNSEAPFILGLLGLSRSAEHHNDTEESTDDIWMTQNIHAG